MRLSTVGRAGALGLILALGTGAAVAQNAGGPPPLEGPPPLPNAEMQIYYAEGTQQRGPVTAEQFRALVQAGTINRQTLVWQKGMAGWTPAGEVQELAMLFQPLDGPPPPPDNQWGQYMLGTWFAEGAYQQLTIENYATYLPDGTFSQAISYFGDDLMNPGRKMLVGTVRLEGTWSAKPMTGDRFQLIMTVTKATDPTVQIKKEPSVNVLQRTGPDSLYNETEKIQARRVSG